MADIYNFESFARGRWKWTQYGYERGFPRGCQFTDVDAMVEIDGRFLFIECKQWDGLGEIPKLPVGQGNALRRLAQQPNTEVLALFGCASCNSPQALRDLRTGGEADMRAYPLEKRREFLARVMQRRLGIEEKKGQTA